MALEEGNLWRGDAPSLRADFLRKAFFTFLAARPAKLQLSKKAFRKRMQTHEQNMCIFEGHKLDTLSY